MIDAGNVNIALATLLKNDQVLLSLGQTGAFDTMAPENQAFRYTVFQQQGESSENTQEDEASVSYRYLIKHIDKGTSAVTVSSMAARVKAMLNRQAITVTGAASTNCRRENGIRFIEKGEGGAIYQHVGGIYRITASR